MLRQTGEAHSFARAAACEAGPVEQAAPVRQTQPAVQAQPVQNSFRDGFHDGVPIGLGYFSVSITFGMMAAAGGLPVWAALAVSMTNVTSAGQFAGLTLIFGGGTLFETALTQLVINLRYALMGLSLSQKLERSVNLPDRLLFSFLLTDEVFAVTSGQRGEVGKRYLFGVMIAPYLGWSLGTLCGAVASGLLPDAVRSALSIAIYGMFIAIVAPVAKNSRPVLGVTAAAVALSCVVRWVSALNSRISGGFSIILCTLLAAGAGALFAPVDDKAHAAEGPAGGTTEAEANGTPAGNTHRAADVPKSEKAPEADASPAREGADA